MAKWLSLEHIKQWLREVEPVSWHAGQTFLLDVGPVFGTLLVNPISTGRGRVFSTSSPVNGSELQNGTSYHLETW